ncbi:hypothetical protein CDES_00410 [Corynebacterium deserti GIMN1.010]|uniref:Amidohydrolase-related domain-containing protein n=1 Tax=Corynebacterium deserti GIMN1.010 TaxID=931089 RepID=A0A0M4CDS6_9CORY|nr:amidohydrolase family protein [Corynebacterium deserti]ALC04565.1 hypothetical protein CDES_00410 [Corynebacterium deserti GIMN1.010]
MKLFDAHFHVIDPAFPLVENNGYMPDPFTTGDYLCYMASHGVDGGAIVSGSFQAFDQGYLRAALKALGPGFVGVTQIPADTPDDDIRALYDDGVRAVRFNLFRGGSAGVDDIDRLARRVYDLVGWHSEFYVDSRSLEPLLGLLKSLPAISIDHLGLYEDGLPNLLTLVEAGAKVKATGLGRISLDPIRVIQEIIAVDPHALMIGTDLPSTRAPRPFEFSDFDIIAAAAGEEHVEKVFWDNAANFYLT